jgi:glycosyltransferase involved in cell wall biosynthesis
VTIDTVAAQSVLPTKWLVVDDGSTDDTPKILKAAAEKYPPGKQPLATQL